MAVRPDWFILHAPIAFTRRQTALLTKPCYKPALRTNASMDTTTTFRMRPCELICMHVNHSGATVQLTSASVTSTPVWTPTDIECDETASQAPTTPSSPASMTGVCDDLPSALGGGNSASELGGDSGSALGGGSIAGSVPAGMDSYFPNQ